MVSIKMERCNMPRPNTMKESALGPGSTRRAKFHSNSRSKRSRKWRDVTNLPSRPKKGELLIVKSILIVGSSTLITGSGSGCSASQTVPPISNPSNPTSAQISPACTDSTGRLLSPSKVYTSFRGILRSEPSRIESVTVIPVRSVPRLNLPTAIRPTYFEYSIEVMSICKVPSDTFGAGMYSTMAFSSGSIFSLGCV